VRKDVAFACERLQVSERRACKLMGMDRGSYRGRIGMRRCEKLWWRSPGRSRGTDIGDCMRC
jgi:hypothetical protein